MTWEKGRQLKTFDDISYEYNANGIRTAKTVGGVRHEYDLEGSNILRESDALGNVIVPLYDGEEQVCGMTYNGELLFFRKNLQGDIIAITDQTAEVVARYSYDAWGKCTVLSDTSGCEIATVNPFRYRGYYYDAEIGMYYLQSRYYNPVVGRFVNGDDAEFTGVNSIALGFNLLAYCEDNPIDRVDPNGYYWHNKYRGFQKTKDGFNVYVDIRFLSRTFCLSYAYDFLKANGKWHWSGRKYSGMGKLRIAQELWFHALIYYIGMPIQKVFKLIGVSWGWLNDKVARAQHMKINSGDSRAWIFSVFWWAGFVVKAALCKRLPVPVNILAAIVL